jgi:hypothetical protein
MEAHGGGKEMEDKAARIDELTRLRRIIQGEIRNPRAAGWPGYVITMEQALNHIEDRLDELTGNGEATAPPVPILRE